MDNGIAMKWSLGEKDGAECKISKANYSKDHEYNAYSDCIFIEILSVNFEEEEIKHTLSKNSGMIFLK